MTSRTFARTVVALAAVLFVGQSARAEYLYQYWVNPVIGDADPTGTVTTVTGTGPTVPGSSSYTFNPTNDPAEDLTTLTITGYGSEGAVLNAALPGGVNNPLALFELSSNFMGDPGRAYNIPFTLNYNLRDVETGFVGTTSITGVLNGLVSSRGSSLKFSSFSLNPTDGQIAIPGTDRVYTILFNVPDNTPGPGIVNPVTLQVAVVPEPGSMALIAMGGLSVAFAMRQRRRLQGQVAA